MRVSSRSRNSDTLRRMEPVIVGGCLCGAVRFASLSPSLFCAHCHCHWCRRAHGAAFVTWLGARADAFTITKGEMDLLWYRSSEQSERGFCTKCGTTMLFRSTLAPGEMHIALGCVEGRVDREPQVHVFYDAHVPWVALADDLPKRDRTHAGIAKYQTIAERPG